MRSISSRDAGADLEQGDPATAPCVLLWKEVIRTAFVDIGTSAQDDAWLRTRDFALVCEMAGVDPDYVRRAYRERIAKLAQRRLDDRSAAFVRLVVQGMTRTMAARCAGFKSRSAPTKLISRPEIRQAIENCEPLPELDEAA